MEAMDIKMVSLTVLPTELLLTLADRLHNIEDYTNLSSTCRRMRSALAGAQPGTILRLAAAQSSTFFRPSPDFLVVATARELGDWARESATNEETLALTFQSGMEGVLDLAVRHCGLTLQRIRELYAMRFSIINPVANIIDQCVGTQWYAQPDFWNTVDDAYTIDADPTSTLFHLAIYGELFGPDLAAYLEGDRASSSRRALSVETRLEYIKYCVPDFACELHGSIDAWDTRSAGGTLDPRRDVKPVGPYLRNSKGVYAGNVRNNNIGLVWTLKSAHWRPHWRQARRQAGCNDFQDGFADDWWYDEDDQSDWRQRLWENVMVCQGLEGLGIIRPELQDGWLERIREWRAKIAALERKPEAIKVGRQATYDYPFLLGDLRICASGYVGGT